MEVREQDRFLPVANIARIMKTVLPANAKIAKDAKETIQECVSEFISFITSEASDKCLQEKRKTINGDDLLWAMSTLGFDRYIEPLKIYLSKYRDTVKGEKPEKGKLPQGQQQRTLSEGEPSPGQTQPYMVSYKDNPNAYLGAPQSISGDSTGYSMPMNPIDPMIGKREGGQFEDPNLKRPKL